MRFSRVGRIIVSVALAAIPLLAAGTLAAPPDRGAVLEAMASAEVPGAAIAILRGGEVEVWTFGSAAPEADVPVTPDTVFEAASLSKTVFAAMFLEEVANGRFSLDETLAQTNASRRVMEQDLYLELTPRLLLSHQSGLPNWAGDASDPGRTDALGFRQRPGSAYGYSGEGYELLRAHVEVTSGMSLERWFAGHRERFGMNQSRYAFDTVPANAAVARGSSPETNRPVTSSSHGLAAASLITTAPDYGRFIRYLLSNDELLSSLMTPQVTVEESSDGRLSWGLGWGIFERRDGGRVAFHWGDNGQFKAFVAIDPDNAVGVVYFANGLGGLRLVGAIAEPVVGRLEMVRDWLGYEDEQPVASE